MIMPMEMANPCLNTSIDTIASKMHITKGDSFNATHPVSSQSFFKAPRP